MAHIRDTAPVVCRGFVIFDVRHAKKPQRRAPRRAATPRLRIGRDHTLENADRGRQVLRLTEALAISAQSIGFYFRPKLGSIYLSLDRNRPATRPISGAANS